MGFSNVWLQFNSQLIILAFKSISVVPWGLRNRWENCLGITHSMRFCATHICADSLANFGLSLSFLDLFWFDMSMILLGGSTLRIGWECRALNSPPFEKVLV